MLTHPIYPKKLPLNLLRLAILFILIFSTTSSHAQSIVAVQAQAGFVICTKTGEIYVVNGATGTSKLLTTAPLAKAINSLATDTTNGIIYYCYNDYISTNKAIYGYNYRTNTHFTLINDFSTAPGGPIIGLGGIGTAGASFYNGYLYVGVEMAQSLSPGVPNIGANVPYTDRLYKVTLNAAGTSITNVSLVKDYYTDNGFIQYNATTFGSTVSSFYQYDHNWGDFIIINDTIFDRSVKGYVSGSFIFEQTTRAFQLSTPASAVYNNLTLPPTTILNDGFSYVQTASDRYGNLILVGNEGFANQYFVIADKTTGSYSVAGAKLLTFNGAPFTKAVTDCANAIKGEASIGDKVWNDINLNGIKEVSEPGIVNVPVELWEDANYNGVIDESTDKLLGTALTASDGSYQFINMLPGNYLLRCIQTGSVNYPAQSFSANYPANPLSPASVLTDAGDENIAGSNATNLLTKSFATITLNDQVNDFGYMNLTLFAVKNIGVKASYNNKEVKLDWETETSTVADYILERSSDGLQYQSIKTGAIYSIGRKIITTYQDINLPAVSVLYYRIRITDKNGLTQISKPVMVKITNGQSKSLTIFPNPAKNKTILSLPQSLVNKPTIVVISNAEGQLVRKFTIEKPGSTEEINLSGIKQGIYYVRVLSAYNQKIVFTARLEIK